MLSRCLLLALLLSAGCSEGQSKKAAEPGPGPQSEASAETMVDATMANDPWAAQVARVDKIVFRFHDASVPPPDHRSYTIVVTASQIEKKVDSYGDIVSEQANALVDAQFDSLKEMLLGLPAVEARDVSKVGCTGGTGHTLSLFVGEQELYAEYLSDCGSAPQSALHSRVKEIGRAAEALLLPSADSPTTLR